MSQNQKKKRLWTSDWQSTVFNYNQRTTKVLCYFYNTDAIFYNKTFVSSEASKFGYCTDAVTGYCVSVKKKRTYYRKPRLTICHVTEVLIKNTVKREKG